jgi:hypothetical protein
VPLSRPARRHRPRLASRARVSALLIGAAVAASACAGGTPPVSVPPPAQETLSVAGPQALVIVLPPAVGLADAERTRVRLLVERALENALPAGTAAPELLEPADADALVDTVERAIRRVGAGGTVCVLGARVWERVAPVFALYPATRLCLVPGAGLDLEAQRGPGMTFVIDIDLERLGRELGLSARAAAGERTVVVVDGGDPFLDRRWRAGLEDGARGAVGMTVTSGPLHVVRTAQDLLTLLDEQAALVAQGLVPGSPEALAGDAGGPPLALPFRDDLPLARSLPQVGVVVLDASSESAALVGALAERGIAVVAPRSLLVAAEAPDAGVVLRWRVRWDVPLTALVQRIAEGGSGSVEGDGVFVLEPGPAHVTP